MTVSPTSTPLSRVFTRLAALCAALVLAVLVSPVTPASASPGLKPAPSEVISQLPTEALTSEIPAPQKVTTTVYDPGSLLSADDKANLERTVNTANFPDSVTKVAFLLFPSNDTNLNDTVRHYVEETNREFISPDGKKFANGSLLLAIGLEPRRLGVYGGDDVLADIQYYRKGREDAIHGSMRELLRASGDPNFALAFQTGLDTATDLSARSTDSSSADFASLRRNLIGIGGLGVAVLGFTFFMGRRIEKNRPKQYVASIDTFRRLFAETALSLRESDIQAHSLTSPLADQRLKKEWDTLQKEFLELDEFLGSGSTFTSNSPWKDIKPYGDKLLTAGQKIKTMKRAQEQINQLFMMENGDPKYRHEAVSELSLDIQKAAANCEVDDLRADLKRLTVSINELADRVDSPTFMNDYVAILNEYQILLEAIRERDTKLSNLRSAAKHTPTRYATPQLGDSNWTPGHVITYATLSSWDHQIATARAESSSSSSGTTSGYSSGGFSGGGSSSSW